MNNENDIKELKKVIEILNKEVDNNLLVYKLIEVRESIIIIMNDEENSYYEIVVIENDIVYFFGDSWEVENNKLKLKNYIDNLKENWVGGYKE